MSYNKNTSLWDHKFWDFLHVICATYDKEYPKDMIIFMDFFIKSIPCKECREDFNKIYDDIPINYYLNDNKQLFWYSYLLHDIVNEKLNKESPPFTEVLEKYNPLLSSNCKKCNLK